MPQKLCTDKNLREQRNNEKDDTKAHSNSSHFRFLNNKSEEAFTGERLFEHLKRSVAEHEGDENFGRKSVALQSGMIMRTF